MKIPIEGLFCYADTTILGFTFRSDQKDDNNILRQLRMLYTKSNRLLRLFHHCSVDVKLALFRSYCTCFYCPFLWTYYKDSNYSKLRVAFNNNYTKITVKEQCKCNVCC